MALQIPIIPTFGELGKKNFKTREKKKDSKKTIHMHTFLFFQKAEWNLAHTQVRQLAILASVGTFHTGRY